MKRDDEKDYRQFAISALHLSHIAVGYDQWAAEGGPKADKWAANAARIRGDAQWLLEAARRKKDNLAQDQMEAA